MYHVEIYQRVRRACHVEGMSIRQAAKFFGLHRKTISKFLSFSIPPGYQRLKPIYSPKLGEFTGIIDAILADDKLHPKKQHHTSKRILQRLRDEHGFTGGYTIVKDYVREQTLRSQEMFIPLVHPPVSRAERKCTGWPEQKCTTRCQRKGPEGPFLSI